MLLLRLMMLLTAVALIFGGLLFLKSSNSEFISFLVAYFTSSLVLIISFKNYQSVVAKGVENEVIVDSRDTIERLDDPLDLYSEDEPTYDKDTPVKEIIKQEKKALRKQKGSFKKVIKNSFYAFKLSRIVGYLALVAGFFYLLNRKMLAVNYYLSALIIPIVVVVIYLFIVNLQLYKEEKI